MSRWHLYFQRFTPLFSYYLKSGLVIPLWNKPCENASIVYWNYEFNKSLEQRVLSLVLIRPVIWLVIYRVFLKQISRPAWPYWIRLFRVKVCISVVITPPCNSFAHSSLRIYSLVPDMAKFFIVYFLNIQNKCICVCVEFQKVCIITQIHKICNLISYYWFQLAT